MADVVELMDFWPMDDDENIGFVAADSDFQLWLISGIGVGFDDISYSVIDGPDSSGIYELIMDFEDYMNLADLYSEYLESGWAGLEEEDFDEVFAAPSDENIEVTFKIQDADMKTFYHTTDAPSGLSDEDIVTYVWGVPSSFNREDNMYHLPYDWEGVGDHFFAKIMSSEEEGNAPIQDPMEFGEMANWTPLDGTPSLKRRKNAEYNVEESEELGYLCDVCDEPTQADYNFQDINVKWTLEDGDFTGEYEMKDHLGDFNDFLCQPCAERMNYEAENRQPPWSSTNPMPNRRIECGVCDARGFIAGKECTTCDGAGYWNIASPRCATCDTDIQWTDGAECDECDEWYCDNHLTEDGGCKVCGNTSLSFHAESFDDIKTASDLVEFAENRQPPWSPTNPKPNRRIECGVCDARGFIAGKECTTCDGAGYWNIASPRCATCDTDIQWTDGAECDGCDEWYCELHIDAENGQCLVCEDVLSFHSESSFMTPDLLWENLGGWWKAVGINPDYDMGQSQGQQQTGGGAGAAAGSGESGESEGQAQQEQEQEQEQEGHRGHGDSSQPVSPHAAEGSGEINIGPVYVTKKVPVLFKHDYVTKDYEWSTDEPRYLTDDQESELVEIVEQIVEDTDSIRGHETFDEYDYKGDVSWDTYKDDGRFYDLAAEGANPSGGATGDQIISWEHNGLSSPSGPPSDIFWSEGSDIRLDAESFEAKGYTTHWKYGTCRGYFGDENHRTNIICDGCGNYACEDCGREPPYIVKQSQPDMRYWCDNCYAKWSDYAFEAEDFNAQMGHSRFQKSDNPRRDIESSTRRKLKQEMFSDVSGVVNTKNMAIVGIAGIVGYLLARK